MDKRLADGPSAIRTGFAHAGVSLLALAGFGASAAAAIQVFGDPAAAGPVHVVNLFDPVEAETQFALKSRLPDETAPRLHAAAFQPDLTDAAEPDLGVEYRPPDADPPAERMVVPVAASVAEPSGALGVRINGKTVLPGEAYSEVRALGALPTSPVDGLYEITAKGPLPVIAPDGRTPADAYARPDHTRPGQPKVAIVLGGLGINYTHTRSAIEELPPEVTLAFAPHARGLRTWVKRARAAGHEVLIEVPLEPFDHGRLRPHNNMLSADVGAGTNLSRLESLMGTATGYFGLINYQGDKFAADPEAVEALLQAVKGRGLAFIEDGSLHGSLFGEAAGTVGTQYARANLVIDSRIDAGAIEAQLMALETEAKKSGAALGTAIAYPLSIDLLKEWTASLQQKGIVLAPASSVTAARVPEPRPMGSAMAGDTSLGSGSLP